MMLRKRPIGRRRIKISKERERERDKYKVDKKERNGKRNSDLT